MCKSLNVNFERNYIYKKMTSNEFELNINYNTKNQNITNVNISQLSRQHTLG